MAATERLFGSSIKRREDPRLITGKGVYVDDVKLPATTYASFVRSPHAHARIKAIDSSAARKLPGVVAVYTGKELSAGGVKSLPVGWLLPNIKLPPHLPLAVDRARYMGDAVAVVIAESPYVARDAADLVEVDYDPLPVVTDAARAVKPDAPKLHDEAPDNVCFRWTLGDKDKTDAACRGAARTGKQHFVNHRLIPNAIEPPPALDSDGRILALRVNSTVNLGAYISLFAPSVPTYLYGTLLAGAYTTPAIHVEVTAAFTNTTPVDAYRGAGRPEACYVVERMVDLAARELGVDPVELRRRNFIAPDKFPYQTPVAVMYDSGNYQAALDKALGMLDYTAFRKEQDRLRKAGRYLGVGFSTYVEACGLAPSQVAGALGAQAGLYESATVRGHPTGKVTNFTGSHSPRHGHQTALAEIAPSQLGCPLG